VLIGLYTSFCGSGEICQLGPLRAYLRSYLFSGPSMRIWRVTRLAGAFSRPPGTLTAPHPPSVPADLRANPGSQSPLVWGQVAQSLSHQSCPEVQFLLGHSRCTSQIDAASSRLVDIEMPLGINSMVWGISYLHAAAFLGRAGVSLR